MADYIAPDYMEPLVAWRYWRLDPLASDPYGFTDYFSVGLRIKTELRSFASYIGVPNVVWPDDKPLTATCRCAEVSRHMANYYTAPVQDTCGECPSPRSIVRPYFPCGIYGWRTRELLLRTLEEQNNSTWDGTWDDGYVFGAVNLWGVVREHADGYRAQYAYPERIIFASAGADTAHAVADKYRIPYDYDMEVEREYRRAETHYYRRTGKIPHSGKVAYACDAPACPICASSGIEPEYWYRQSGSQVKMKPPTWIQDVKVKS